MELIIKSNLTALEEVEFNFDDLKKHLQDKLSTYQGLVYNEAQIKEAKEDRASLNKLKTEIENKRKEVKTQVNKPYADFEVKVKELVALVQAPIDEIDSQVKASEERAKEEKRELINKFYSDSGAAELPLNRIFKEQWLNASMSMKKVQEEIMDMVTTFKRDMNVIKDLNSPFYDMLKGYYLSTHDLGYVIQEKAKLEQAQTIVLVKQEEEKKIVVEEPKKEDGLVTFTIKITTDKERMDLLKQFIVINEIQYERIK